MKIFTTATLSALYFASTVNANTLYADIKVTDISPKSSNWLRENKDTAKYPVSLARNGIAGCAVMKVQINANGKTDSVEVLQSVPKKLIVKPSKRIIKSWQWQQAPNGQQVPEQKIVRLDYCIGGESTEQARAICLKQSQLNCQN